MAPELLISLLVFRCVYILYTRGYTLASSLAYTALYTLANAPYTSSLLHGTGVFWVTNEMYTDVIAEYATTNNLIDTVELHPGGSWNLGLVRLG